MVKSVETSESGEGRREKKDERDRERHREKKDEREREE